MTERTMTALRNSLDGKVYIIIKGDELQKQFLKDAETEGFRFGTINPTGSSTDDVIALEPNKQLSYVGFAGRAAIQCNGGNNAEGQFHLIDYVKFKGGDDEYYYHRDFRN